MTCSGRKEKERLTAAGSGIDDWVSNRYNALVGSVCKVRTQEAENFEEVVKPLESAWQERSIEGIFPNTILVFKRNLSSSFLYSF